MFVIALPILVIVHFYSMKYTKRKDLKFANFEALERIVGKRLISKNWTLLIIRCTILFLLIFSAAGTVYWYTGWGSEFDYVLLIDGSTSMMADDFSPNRIEAAKEAANVFVDSLKGKANIGVATFTGTIFVKERLTDEKNKVKNAINKIEIEEIGGTAIGDAMVTISNTMFEDDKSNIIILLTDGQNNVGISPETAIEYLNDNKVMVYTIGMATEEGGTFAGLGSLSTLDEETLQLIAGNTGGKYFSAKNLEDLKKAYRSIGSFEKKRLSKKLGISFMIIALFLLLIEWGLMNSKYRTLP